MEKYVDVDTLHEYLLTKTKFPTRRKLILDVMKHFGIWNKYFIKFKTWLSKTGKSHPHLEGLIQTVVQKHPLAASTSKSVIPEGMAKVEWGGLMAIVPREDLSFLNFFFGTTGKVTMRSVARAYLLSKRRNMQLLDKKRGRLNTLKERNEDLKVMMQKKMKGSKCVYHEANAQPPQSALDCESITIQIDEEEGNEEIECPKIEGSGYLDAFEMYKPECVLQLDQIKDQPSNAEILKLQPSNLVMPASLNCRWSINDYLQQKVCRKYKLIRSVPINDRKKLLENFSQGIKEFRPHVQSLSENCLPKIRNTRSRSSTIRNRVSPLHQCQIQCRKCRLDLKFVLMNSDSKLVHVLLAERGNCPKPESFKDLSKQMRNDIVEKASKEGSVRVQHELIGAIKDSADMLSIPTLNALRTNVCRKSKLLKLDDKLQLAVGKLIEVEKEEGTEYVQSLEWVSNTVIMFSIEQLEILQSSRQLVLYLDATGSIVRTKSGKNFLYHAAVFHSTDGQVIPACEMITTESNSLAIDMMLSKLNQTFRKKLGQELNFTTIVTDQSWPNINGILTSFKMGTIFKHLDELWLAGNKWNQNKITLCYAHIMHSISSKTKSFLSRVPYKYRQVVMLICSKIADSTTREQTLENFKNLCYVLCRKKIDDKLAALLKFGEYTHEDSDFCSYGDEEGGSAIKDKTILGKTLLRIKSQVISDISDTTGPENKLYCPGLLDHLITFTLVFIPLFSCLCGPKLTNGTIERWHRTVKEDILDKHRDFPNVIMALKTGVLQRCKKITLKIKEKANTPHEEVEVWKKRNRKKATYSNLAEFNQLKAAEEHNKKDKETPKRLKGDKIENKLPIIKVASAGRQISETVNLQKEDSAGENISGSEKYETITVTDSNEHQPPKPYWIRELNLMPESLRRLQSAAEWLSSDEIDAYICLLEKIFPNIRLMLSLTAVSPRCLTDVREKFTIVINNNHLQPFRRNHKGELLTLGSHWVVISNIMPTDGPSEQKIPQLVHFCSLNADLSKDVITFVRKLYRSLHVNCVQVNSFKVEKQKDGSSCGLYALAYLHTLLEGENPSFFRYANTNLRLHLLRCFEKKNASPFPAVKLPISEINNLTSKALMIRKSVLVYLN